MWKCYIFLWKNGQSHMQFSSAQFSHSVMSDSLHPMNHSTPGLPVHHQLPEFTQTHVHWVGDAIQPSHPLSSPSPPAPSPSLRLPRFNSRQGIMILLHATAHCCLIEIRRKGGRKSGREAGRFQKSSQIEYLHWNGDIGRWWTCPLVRKMKVTWLFFKQ